MSHVYKPESYVGRRVSVERAGKLVAVRIKAHEEREHDIVFLTDKGYEIVERDWKDRNGYCALHSGGEDEAAACNNPHDHCRHGVYVGGCGADYMCGQCEMGEYEV